MRITRRFASDTILKRHTAITVRLYVRLFTVPYFLQVHRDRALCSTGGHLGLICTKGLGIRVAVPCLLSTFDTHPQARLGTFKIKMPIMQSA